MINYHYQKKHYKKAKFLFSLRIGYHLKAIHGKIFI